MTNYYEQIFKRKSFHFFSGKEKTSEEDLDAINAFIKNIVPLYPDIKTEIEIVKESETTCHRGAEYCILFYSETKGEYLRNIGYIGEQIDLFLASRNIGALWFGIGKPKEKKNNGLDYVIMIAIKRMPENSFRKDMFKSKRKPLEEIWSGEELNIANIVRFAPSACNTQPWLVENQGNTLSVYRYKKPGKRGIMPIDKVMYYNRIDIGIFLFILETCLNEQGISYDRELFEDLSNAEVEKTLTAEYRLTIK
ncbi:MAG: nitroreductase [Bacilli bacterium]|nr:nitroreductase [Bacilli bacterium]